ncbi:hypothetical protein BDV96DRAFT_646136 [Lophiotrema nucula]|uniref:Uncharacterized protein n=1 Tax=Lophiotrema nucula TaxID=690887 RepID=A0A6A5ZC39_9PLEO|nr:hypothetical protein BDV96DRAFT_646136 [Lophiotrema nucula]
MRTEGFTKLHPSNSTNKPDSIRYYYGQALGIVSYKDPSFTYQTSPWPDYVVSSVTNEQFDPILQLYRADGDTSLLFFSAPGLSYINPTDDPWFSAHTTPNDSTKGHIGTQTVTLYNLDEPAGVMGCFSQFQFCNPSLPEPSRCETLNGTNADYFEPLDRL